MKMKGLTSVRLEVKSQVRPIGGNRSFVSPCTQVRQTPSSFLPDIGDGDLISFRKSSDVLNTVGFCVALVMNLEAVIYKLYSFPVIL